MKRGLISNYIIIMIICQVAWLLNFSYGQTQKVSSIQNKSESEELTNLSSDKKSLDDESKKEQIVEHCTGIRESLKLVQRDDSRLRVGLGRYYEIILNKFITPLNVRLVENNLPNVDLINNQNTFIKTRTSFTIDYIEYQRELEELILIDCKTKPDEFYTKLETVRARRAQVSEDANRIKELTRLQIELTNKIKDQL